MSLDLNDQFINNSQCSPKLSFTLIELFIVIAMIALLAAILFPVFGRARENARRSSCQSNLKQIALGITQNTQDYDERFPITNSASLYGTGFNRLSWALWLVHVYPYVKSTQIFRCPSSARGATRDVTFTGTSSGDLTFPLWYKYGYNQNLMDNPGGYFPSKSLASIQQPSRLPLVADCTGTVANLPPRIYNASNPIGQWYDNPAEVDTKSFRHLNGSNVAFIDGHVKYMSQGQMGPDPARASLSVEEDRALLPIRPEDDRVQ